MQIPERGKVMAIHFFNGISSTINNSVKLMVALSGSWFLQKPTWQPAEKVTSGNKWPCRLLLFFLFHCDKSVGIWWHVVFGFSSVCDLMLFLTLSFHARLQLASRLLPTRLSHLLCRPPASVFPLPWRFARTVPGQLSSLRLYSAGGGIFSLLCHFGKIILVGQTVSS